MVDAAPKPHASGPRQKGRSPAYPSISLKEAIDKAKAQYDAEGKYAVPLPSAFKAWGYSAKSSGGRDVRASLRYFGLIAVDGDGDTAKVKLTEDALRVLIDTREDQSEKKTIVRRIALNPSAHKKLWTRFPEGIKSDATASHFLIFEEGFNPEAANALVAEYKATATYAGLYEASEDRAADEDKSEIESLSELPPNAPDQGKVENDQRAPPAQKQHVDVAHGERVAFIEESQPGQYLKLIASGDVDDFMLEALEDYVKRQRKRIAAAAAKAG